MPAEAKLSTPRQRAIALAALLVAAAGAHGQQARSLVVTPTFSAAQTWTDNRTLSATDKQSDFVTEISPGVQLQSRSGPVTGTLDYQLTGVIHRNLSELNETRHTFNAALLVRPVDEHFSVATRASMSRQTVSAFGVQAANPALESPNTTTVASAGVTPHLKGTLGGVVAYDVQVSRDITRARDTDSGDMTGTSAQAGLSGRSGTLGWGLNASRMRVDYRKQPRSTDDRAYASINWFPDPDFRFTLRGGEDRSDALGEGMQSQPSYGAGMSWKPSPRTTFGLDVDKRYYGTSHALSFEWRTPRTLWRVIDSRSADSFSGSGSIPITLMDYARMLMGPQASAQLTDAQLLELMRTRFPSLDPKMIVGDLPFLLSTRSLTRQSELTMLYTGQRTNFGLSFFRTQAESLQSTDLFGDSQTPLATVYSLSSSVTHRLTPIATLSLVGTLQRTGSIGDVRGNSLKTINLLWSTQASRRASVTLGGHHSIFDGPSSYDETGISATLSLQF